MFLICCVTQRDHMFKKVSKVIGESCSQKVTTLSCLVVIVVMEI